jgi:hypothetical protein
MRARKPALVLRGRGRRLHSLRRNWIILECVLAIRVLGALGRGRC